MWEPVVVAGVTVGMSKSQPGLVSVEPLGGSRLLLEFETGEQRELDARPFIERGGAYRLLDDEAYFGRVRIIDGGMALGWPEGQEVYPEALFDMSVPCRP